MNEGSMMKKVHPTALRNLKTMHSRFHIWSKLAVQAASMNYCKTNLTPVKKTKRTCIKSPAGNLNLFYEKIIFYIKNNF